jgi:hypothetical protein
MTILSILPIFKFLFFNGYFFEVFSKSFCVDPRGIGF